MGALKALLPIALALLVAGCGAVSTADSGGRLRVVAAENFWGSIAAQLGGNRVQVTSIVHNPAADPHDYEPTPADARDMAEAQLAIVNGVGYDPWASKLIDANPVDGREVITAGDVAGVKSGDNPHLWYSPQIVERMIGAITTSYKKLDPAHGRYYERQRASFGTHALAEYRSAIATIRRKYAGTPVGASESIFQPLAQSLGLKLITPSSLLDAVSEGADPTASAKSQADDQIAKRQIRVWVFNSQNATPDVQRLTGAARAQGIPTTTITETLTPESASFQSWQSRELRALQQALARGTGR
jgi:zinc/manganese transport system substrate-binding protein